MPTPSHTADEFLDKVLDRMQAPELRESLKLRVRERDALAAQLESIASDKARAPGPFAYDSPKNPNGRLPALTHAQAVNFFPILRGRREGFDKERIDPIAFPDACQKHGGGAFKCAKFILSLMGYESRGFTLDSLLHHVDTEHRRAAVALFAAVAERGIA